MKQYLFSIHIRLGVNNKLRIVLSNTLNASDSKQAERQRYEVRVDNKNIRDAALLRKIFNDWKSVDKLKIQSLNIWTMYTLKQCEADNSISIVQALSLNRVLNGEPD